MILRRDVTQTREINYRKETNAIAEERRGEKAKRKTKSERTADARLNTNEVERRGGENGRGRRDERRDARRWGGRQREGRHERYTTTRARKHAN